MEAYSLVDSGAARSMISERKWKELCTTTNRPAALKTGLQLRSLSGHLLPTKGLATIPILGKSIELYVTDSLQHDMLLGIDALKVLEMKMCCVEGTITLGGQVFGWGHRDPVIAEIRGAHVELDHWKNTFPNLFIEKGEELPPVGDIIFTVDVGNAAPIRMRPYRIPLAKKEIIDKEIDKLLAGNIITPSTSPWVSPILLIPKKDGTIRVCVDYRRVNSVTKKDAHPIPHIQDIFDGMVGSRVFSVLDLKSAYWQVPVHEDAKEITAFVSHRGLYQFNRMPMGMANSPGVWQRHINSVLAPFLGKFCMVYLDDIIVYSVTDLEHTAHLEMVMKALQDRELTLNPEKCSFRNAEVKLLGYIVSRDGISPNPEKVEAIKDMAPPEDCRGVQRFLGMAGYYRQCIPNFSEIAEPLIAMTRKGSRFRWREKEEEAWTKLKNELTSEQVMAFPDVSKPYRLYTDSSCYSIGGILTQVDEKGLERPIHYFSKALKQGQIRWATVEKEAYAVVYALKKLRPYLHGATFTIVTDHKPLKCLFLSEIQNTKIQRWAVNIAEFGAPIEYRKGAYNVCADMLSRIRKKKPLEG